jgi:hypothetical protein
MRILYGQLAKCPHKSINLKDTVGKTIQTICEIDGEIHFYFDDATEYGPKCIEKYTLEEAYHSLTTELRNDTNIASIGMAAKSQYNPIDYIVIYLIQRTRTAYPNPYKGFRVEVMIIGELTLN